MPAAKPKKTGPKRPGSGIPARKVIRALVWVRRASQIGFFALFLYFLAQTAFRGTFAATAGEPVRLPLPVEGFLLADPFVARDDAAQHAHGVSRAWPGRWSSLALTLVFGRVFCGWICPFGTLHHFFGWIFPSRYVRGNKRVEANKTHWLPGREVLPDVGVPRRGGRGQRDRRPLRSDLRRRAHDRPRRDPGAAVLRRALGDGDRQQQRARVAERDRRHARRALAHGVDRQPVLLPPDLVDRVLPGRASSS